MSGRAEDLRVSEGKQVVSPILDGGARHNELWRRPRELVERNKLELQSRGESIVERLAKAPVPVRLKYPQVLTPDQTAQFDSETLGIPYFEIRRETMFDMYVYGDKTTGEEHVAVIKGTGNGEDVPIRIHSSCLTAETFAASNCDCQEQLDKAMVIADNEGYGGVIWLHQEGRGNGLAAKADQLKLMVYNGLNTVEAYEALGLPSEQRDFTAATNILNDLGIKSVRLITNNPDKIAQIRAQGIEVTDQIPCIIPPLNDIVLRDLRAKRDSHGHTFREDL